MHADCQFQVGVYTFGSRGEILFANDVWFDMFCLSRKTAGEQKWRESTHPEDIHMVDEKWRLLTDHGISHAQFEFRVKKRLGQDWTTSEDYKILSSSCFAEMDQEGNFKSVTGVIIDNTLDRAHEREVAERLTSALEAKRAQENFMGQHLLQFSCLTLTRTNFGRHGISRDAKPPECNHSMRRRGSRSDWTAYCDRKLATNAD